MADIVYSMNQYRYKGTSGVCMHKKQASPKYLDWRIESENSPYYRDIVIGMSNTSSQKKWGEESFIENVSYYIRFGVPRNLNYDFNIAIKLLQSYKGFLYQNTKTEYQFIKYISARRTADNGTFNSLVVLYQPLDENGEQDGQPKSAVQHCDKNVVEGKTYWEVTINPVRPLPVEQSGCFYEINKPDNYRYYPNVLYHNQENDVYWMFGVKEGMSGEEDYLEEFGKITDDTKYYTKIGGNCDIVLNWTWTQDETSNISYFNLILTPTKSFPYVLLQLERIQEDKDIITSKLVGNDGNDLNAFYQTDTHPGQGQPVYGRFIDLEQGTGKGSEQIIDTFEVYELENLNTVNNTYLTTNGAPINRLGIWGHPELMMAINGEEIQIGQSGYYELNDFNVNSFAVAADGIKDSFVLDYQYVV